MTSQIFPLAADKLQLQSATIAFQESLIKIVKLTKEFGKNPDPMDPILVKAFAISREVESSTVLAPLVSYAPKEIHTTLSNFDSIESQSQAYCHDDNSNNIDQLRPYFSSGLTDTISGLHNKTHQPHNLAGATISTDKYDESGETLQSSTEPIPPKEEKVTDKNKEEANKLNDKQVGQENKSDTKPNDDDKDEIKDTTNTNDNKAFSQSPDIHENLVRTVFESLENQALYNEYKNVAIQDLMKYSIFPVHIEEKEVTTTDYIYKVTINHTVFGQHRGTKKYAKTMAVIKACRNKDILAFLPMDEAERWSSFYFRNIELTSNDDSLNQINVNADATATTVSDVTNAKNTLYSVLGKRNIIPEYKYEVKNSVFHCQIVINNVVGGVGVGSSKKMAGESAAKEVLVELQDRASTLLK